MSEINWDDAKAPGSPEWERDFYRQQARDMACLDAIISSRTGMEALEKCRRIEGENKP